MKRKNLLITIAGLGAVALLGCCLLAVLGNLLGPTEPAAPVEALPSLTPTAGLIATLAPAETFTPSLPAETPIPATAAPAPLPTVALETPTVMPAPLPTEVPAPTDAAPPPIPPPSDGGDWNCGDFSSQAEAQAFYEGEGGPAIDPHDLDRDRDGVACENTDY